MAGSIVFPTFAALADPATPSSADKFEATYNMLAAPNFTKEQRQILDLVNGITIAANGGENKNYASAHAALMSDARAFAGGISNFDFRIALSVLLYVKAKALSAGITTDISTLLGNGWDFQSLSPMDMDRMLAVLLYRFAV